MSNWREILKNQEEDLKRMEEMDAALNEDQEGLDFDIKTILKGTKITSKFKNERKEINEEKEPLRIKQDYNFNTNTNTRIPTNTNHSSSTSTSSITSNNRNKIQGNQARKLRIEEEEEDFNDDNNNNNNDFLDHNHNNQIDDFEIQTSRSEKSISSPSSTLLKDQNIKQAPDTSARSVFFFFFPLLIKLIFYFVNLLVYLLKDYKRRD